MPIVQLSCPRALIQFRVPANLQHEYTLDERGWPEPKTVVSVKEGQVVVLATAAGGGSGAPEGAQVLPVSYEKLGAMCQVRHRGQGLQGGYEKLPVSYKKLGAMCQV